MSVDNKSANNKSTEDVRASLIFDALQCSPPSVWFTRLDQRLRFVIVVGVGTSIAWAVYNFLMLRFIVFKDAAT